MKNESYSHSHTLACSTKNLISLSVDAVAQTATVDSGVQLRPFLDEIAKYDLAFPTSPYWSGVSMAGVIGTGAHGSTLVGKVIHGTSQVGNVCLVVQWPSIASRVMTVVNLGLG